MHEHHALILSLTTFVTVRSELCSTLADVYCHHIEQGKRAFK